MLKRFLPIVILGLLVLSLALAACGDSATAVPAPAATTAAPAAAFPTYSGASPVTVPEAIKGDPGDLAKKLKNPNFTAFTTGDDSSKVKSSFQSSFSGAGWSDITDKEFPATTTQPMTQLGITPLAFQKGNQTATLTLYTPGDVTKALGFNDLTGGTLYIVITGDNS
jgi:hypothetical protein